MTEEVGEDGRVPVAEAPLPLPVEFEALYILHQEGFHELALAVLGTRLRWLRPSGAAEPVRLPPSWAGRRSSPGLP
ncbi:hypothetical protein AB0L10_43030 [Streptomyces flaveolus]|uniref:hypothetical protein n=1 Tax=Streptomyces flaveolus TaxID=67297 RepID=UPI00343F8514